MNVPEIRFKEFCDYYSDVLLEKCLSVSNKKNNKLEYLKSATIIQYTIKGRFMSR